MEQAEIFNEYFLQELWRQQKFNDRELTTTAGHRLKVIHPGTWNHDQGPDFLTAIVECDGVTWVGQVEIHMNSSDWNRHGHKKDIHYQNVILHVVWKEDVIIYNSSGKAIPTLELAGRIPLWWLQQSDSQRKVDCPIPCHSLLKEVPASLFYGILQENYHKRIEGMADFFIQILGLVKQDWQEAVWVMLARSFGMPVNKDSFQEMALSLPYKIILKHRHCLAQIEALLCGQAGLLKVESRDPYPQMLAREFDFLARKYKLKPISVQVRKLRMRPSSFPALRLAQLAVFLHKNAELFSTLKAARGLTEFRVLLDVSVDGYWNYHYTFGKPSSFQELSVGQEMTDRILINAVIPILWTWHGLKKEWNKQKEILSWPVDFKPENNRVTRMFSLISRKPRHSIDSQGMLELYSKACLRKGCLDCEAGKFLLQR